MKTGKLFQVLVVGGAILGVAMVTRAATEKGPPHHTHGDGGMHHGHHAGHDGGTGGGVHGW